MEKESGTRMASTKEEEEVSSKAEVEEEEKEKEEAFQATKEKGKGNVLAGVCHYCGKPGHYESQCRKKERDLGGVREVQEEDEKSSAGVSSAAASVATTMRTANSSSSAAQAKASAAGTRSVRQLAMYHMAEPEEDSKLFHLDEGEEEDDDCTVDYFGRVLRIEEFSLCDSDSDCISACEESACDGQQHEGDDPVMSWWMSEESAIRAVQSDFVVRRSTRAFWPARYSQAQEPSLGLAV